MGDETPFWNTNFGFNNNSRSYGMTAWLNPGATTEFNMFRNQGSPAQTAAQARQFMPLRHVNVTGISDMTTYQRDAIKNFMDQSSVYGNADESPIKNSLAEHLHKWGPAYQLGMAGVQSGLGIAELLQARNEFDAWLKLQREGMANSKLEYNNNLAMTREDIAAQNRSASAYAGAHGYTPYQPNLKDMV